LDSSENFSKGRHGICTVKGRGCTMTAPISIFVFSFNRGIFLENCLSSIELCASDLPVTIIDDGSTDPDTIKTLSRLSQKYEVILPKAKESEAKTGGLYANMNHALKMAHSNGISRALFIQDDMQFVRKITHEDFNVINRFFQLNENCIQFQTCFRRLDVKRKLETSCYTDKSNSALLIKDDMQKGKDNFSATGVFDVDRSLNLLGSFVVGEGANSSLCRERGIKKPYSLFPFMNWLPYPTSHRGKVRKLSHRLIEYLGGSGFHPITYMSDAEIDYLFSRDPLSIPLAEEWLFSKSSPRHDLWSTAGGEYNLVARGSIAGRFFVFIKSLVQLKKGKTNE